MGNSYIEIDESKWDTPLFDWGKYYEKDGRLMMPVSVQAHHSFVDGIHIGEFVNALEKYLAGF